MQTAAYFGAAPGDWDHFDLILGLGADLLPVVSNPKAVISPQSKMAALGKTPSRYNKASQVAGIADWTSHYATSDELAVWSQQPDYGICVQTRTVRAIDVDIEDPTQAKEIYELLEELLLLHALPARRRAGSSKFLCPISLPDGTDYVKRVIKTRHGIIEFLATGQQFIASGTHPSGVRYDWGNAGLPACFPEVTPEQFENLWSTLEKRFGVEPSKTSTTVSRAAKLTDAVTNDETAVALYGLNMVLSSERDGRLHITCPFEDEHTPGPSAESATTYWPANTGGYSRGHFHCLHAHCADRTDHNFLSALGLAPDPADDYEPIDVEEQAISPPGIVSPAASSDCYAMVPSKAFSNGAPMGWWVKGLIPKADLGVVYGPPASGKSFWVLDLVMAIARGEDWCGLKTHRGRVVYVVAEGAGGFKNRIQAHEMHHGLKDEDDIKVIADVPNLTRREDVIKLGNTINRGGGADILVYDTLARGTSGADENSAKDMGVAIEHCRALRKATGAMVLLVHHSGKDASKGARGSNSILGAVDFEIEISRFDNARTATVRKMKDGTDLEQYGFKLKTILIGMDEDGDEISSCVVEHGPVSVASREKVKKRGPNEQQLLVLIADLTQVSGVRPIQMELEAAFIAPGESADARRKLKQAFGRAFRTLESSGGIAVVDGRVSIVSMEA